MVMLEGGSERERWWAVEVPKMPAPSIKVVGAELVITVCFDDGIGKFVKVTVFGIGKTQKGG